jgi:hypothetical protein
MRLLPDRCQGRLRLLRAAVPAMVEGRPRSSDSPARRCRRGIVLDVPRRDCARGDGSRIDRHSGAPTSCPSTRTLRVSSRFPGQVAAATKPATVRRSSFGCTPTRTSSTPVCSSARRPATPPAASRSRSAPGATTTPVRCTRSTVLRHRPHPSPAQRRATRGASRDVDALLSRALAGSSSPDSARAALRWSPPSSATVDVAGWRGEVIAAVRARGAGLRRRAVRRAAIAGATSGT